MNSSKLFTLVLVIGLLISGLSPVQGSPQHEFIPEITYLDYSEFEALEGGVALVAVGPNNRYLSTWELPENSIQYPRFSSTVYIPYGATDATVTVFFYPSTTDGNVVSLFGAVHPLGGGAVLDNDSPIFSSNTVPSDAYELTSIVLGTWEVNQPPLFKNPFMRLVIGRDGGETDTHDGPIYVVGVAVFFE
jgi:hypothetical protein